MNDTLLNRAKDAFYEVATTGNLRGRDAFCKLLDASLNLRLSLGLGGMDDIPETAYALINTTKSAFESMLKNRYRLAARQNYEDSTDANFLTSGRAVTEALTDLHLVPVYMALGGLDPVQEESWQECGMTRAGYRATYSARRIQEAARLHAIAHDPARSPQDCVSALDGALYRLKEDGRGPAAEETYAALGTTRAEFEAFKAKNQELINRQLRF